MAEQIVEVARDDIVTICGIRYSGELFHAFGFHEGWVCLEKRADGVLTIRMPSKELDKTFTALCAR